MYLLDIELKIPKITILNVQEELGVLVYWWITLYNTHAALSVKTSYLQFPEKSKHNAV